MPSTNQAGSGNGYNDHPNLVQDYNENPARFLGMSEPQTALALIAGIQDIGRLNAWRAVERQDFGGRSIILDAIEEQKDEIVGGDDE